mmetsp:Transcript_3245/g.5899  ORF Transcript_3245/g.5899 Transcript_3245/m.5899 type:complete len:514 (-) Transcript_3245:146-1687(-)
MHVSAIFFQGGSIGSALAILTFFPLERIRVELQAQGSNNDPVERANDKMNKRTRSDDHHDECVGIEPKNSTNPRMENNGSDESDSNNNHLISRIEVDTATNFDQPTQQKGDSTESSMGSFELVSAHASMDSDSMGSLSSGEVKDECVHGPDIAAGSGGEGGNTFQECLALESRHEISNVDRRDRVIETINDNASVNPSESQEASSDINPSGPETIVECFLRLCNEKTLYKGASHMVTTLTISNFIFFYALQVTKRSLSSTPISKMTASLLSSSLAGAINVILTNPLWVASLRIMESKVPSTSSDNGCNTEGQHADTNLWRVTKRIAKSEGVLQLWNGMFVSLLLVSNPAIQHFLYGQLRTWLLDMRNANSSGHGRGLHPSVMTLTPLEAFFFGALAKTGATVVTYPLQLAQVLLRLQSKRTTMSTTLSTVNSTASNVNGKTGEIIGGQYSGTIDCLYQQFRRGGLPALFHGMNAKLLQTVLTAAFTFLTYEQTLTLVGWIYGALRYNHARKQK